MEKENPVSDVVRVKAGQWEIVSSAKIKVEGWVFGAIRVNGHHYFQTISYLNSDLYTPPPCHIKAEANRIAGGLFKPKLISRVFPSQGVLIP